MEPKTYANDLHRTDPVEINAIAVRLLSNLLNHSSLNLVSKLTGITRPTLYRWLDESLTLDQMNHMAAAWFIVLYETKPQIQMLLQRAPSRTHLAHRMITEE